MNSQITSLTITRPDDWHLHLRDGEALERTAPDIAQYFQRGIIMPNLVPPVVNAEQALAYEQRIKDALPEGNTFQPLMTLYLTDNTTAEDIAEAAKHDSIVACKLYPAGATTNSDSGVTDIKNIYPVLQAMSEHGILLLVHGEVTDHEIDIFDREAEFIERILKPVVKEFPELKIVLEHITTQQAVEFVESANDNVAATITAHHLLFNRNDMLAGGIRPHYYCLPILKRSLHQQALLTAATSGNPKFFLGTDSAPHAQHAKEASCGCAGCYTAPFAIELYAEAFEQMNALDKLEGFASFFGPDFYDLPRNTDNITLNRRKLTIPETMPYLQGSIVPLLAGETINWSVDS